MWQTCFCVGGEFALCLSAEPLPKPVCSWTTEAGYWPESFISAAVRCVDDNFVTACYLAELAVIYFKRL